MQNVNTKSQYNFSIVMQDENNAVAPITVWFETLQERADFLRQAVDHFPGFSFWFDFRKV